jgi:4-O-beta-D-mannosyl-D-glucose phosphorylase
MRTFNFEPALKKLQEDHQKLMTRKNEPAEGYNGIFIRYKYPVVTAAHIPIHWRFDLDKKTNPLLLERIGVNAAFNSGAIEFNGKICLMVRVEGNDRKSYFAVAESDNGIDNFRFWDYPVWMPPTDEQETNIYDMRLTRHQDGWIYGLFCAERKDPDSAPGDTSSALARCGIARTHDLKNWERLPDLKTKSLQQRNVVLHPEFVDGKYALYTRPQDYFMDAGTGGGISWVLIDSMENAEIDQETLIDPRVYHTIKEAKNGQGPAPIKTEKGWLNLAHGVRGCASGLRYVLYMYMTDLKNPSLITHRPGGHFMAPKGEERVGDVSNVLFTNGWVEREDGMVLIYYGSSDTRMHVAATTVERLVDYVINTPEDGYTHFKSVQTLYKLIDRNMKKTIN